MITFNEAKQLLDQGIFPCLNNNGWLDYIIEYDENTLECHTMKNRTLSADSIEAELSISGGAAG